MKLGIIYKVANKINGKCYIGQTLQAFAQRKGEHLRTAFSKKNARYNSHFYRAIRKYGIEAFEWEILAEGIPIDCLNTEEIKTIGLFDTFSNGYNSHSGGGNGRLVSEETAKKISLANKGNKVNLGRKHSDETKKKISLAGLGQKRSEEFKKELSNRVSGDKNPMYGKTHSEETRAKLSQSSGGENNPNFGKHWSDEMRKHMSDIQKGRKYSEEMKEQRVGLFAGDKNPMYGKHHSDETLRKISEAKKGKRFSIEHREKISKGLLRFNRNIEVSAIS